MVRIPPALKWMLNRRARLLGEIQKVEKRQSQREVGLAESVVALEKRLLSLKRRLHISSVGTPQRIAALRIDLEAIDRSIGQHKVMVDVDAIPSIRSQDSAWYLPFGQMSRLILKALRESAGEALTTGEVAVFVATFGKLEIDSATFRPFKIAIRRRMRTMQANGLIRRVEIGTNTMDSRWASAPSDCR